MVVKVCFKNDSSWLSAQGYSITEQAIIYDECLEDVIENTAFYLDQLDYIREFRVSWVDYRKQNITKPYKFTQEYKKKQEKEKHL